MEISIVVPVHDEQDNVLPLVREIAAVLPALGEAEVIFVDDASADGTVARLREARAAHLPGLRILRHARNRGQSTALWNGARAARGRWLAMLDGDGQNDPADLPKLLDALSRDPSLRMAVGHRAARRDGWVRRISSRVANGVRGRLLGDGTPDTGCGLKVVEREAFLALPYFDHMHRFLPALVQRDGGGVASVPVGHRPRAAGRSHYGIGNRLWVGLVDLAGVAWLQRRHRRGEAPEEL